MYLQVRGTQRYVMVNNNFGQQVPVFFRQFF